MKNKILICGEAWGDEEARQKVPFVGPSGYLLTNMLREAGIERVECYITNVFALQPPGNNLDYLCVKSKKESTTNLPALSSGKYLDAKYLPELHRLYREIDEVQPNLILALGNCATWALLHNTGITKIRGTVTRSIPINGRSYKVLPCIHPAAILRQWELRHVTVLDFAKGKIESAFPEIKRPARTVFMEPSLEDLQWFEDNHINHARELSIDIETHGRQITCIGFAPTVSECLVLPFTDSRKPGNNYWPSLEDELIALGYMRRWLNSHHKKTLQNGLYDLQFIWKYGMTVTNCEDDTMLCHHSLQPESPKGLGFLGSVYTSEPAWKMMRERGKKTIKADE